MIELDDGVIGPELLANFLAEHYLSGLLQQHHKDLHGLFPHAEANAGSIHRRGSQVRTGQNDGHGMRLEY
jgi:hypothetical protein